MDSNITELWVTVARRTGNPKLSWLRAEMFNVGIKSKIDGASFHAPILKVRAWDKDRAMDIIDAVDDIPDEDSVFMEVSL